MKTPGDQSSEGRVNSRELEPVWDHSKLCCSAIWLCFFILRAFAERGETGERRCQRADVNSYSEQASVSVNAQAPCGCDPDRQSSAALLSLRIVSEHCRKNEKAGGLAGVGSSKTLYSYLALLFHSPNFS